MVDTVIKMIWSTVKESFETNRGNVRKHIRAFEEEARINIDEITVRGLDDIMRRLSSREAPNLTKLRTNSIVPFPRNDFFTGREEELRRMHNILTYKHADGTTRCNVCVIHSMGGVGKTQLAREYMARFQKEYDYVFWLAAERGPGITQGFGSIGQLVDAAETHDEGPVSLNKHIRTA
jgi:hypothetical protein